ncbi:hypothetical protein [Streptomyces sp. JB150]|uniref:hypothetical protein n=1 Tax=Streptomyces sp. JB150 TaxID=2714844 RepID=UPI00140857E4|nr:hypothetical protein [Streptomyces sp. JB150]QIJ66228.1 hypothetical protein G7Z13_32600 [Streptomyces sp. JB150]
MPTSTTAHPMTPPTVWLARGRHVGAVAEDVLRRRLRDLKARGVIHDHMEPPQPEDHPDKVFEARWAVAGDITVRARLTLAAPSDGGREWVLAAEAEAVWDPEWPSPATMFWPEEADGAEGTETEWDRLSGSDLRLRDINPLPADDKELRRVLRDAAPDTWAVHIVVHEAMTPDERGRRPLAPLLPPGLRHRVVEHRAAPHQLRAVNWALREFGVELPRGGAVVLPGVPAPEGYDSGGFSVRTVFLDGSRPTELIGAVNRFARTPRPLPKGADEVITALREDWHLLTLEEELERQRALVAMYAEALEAMTRSRDLYREAAERANEALAAYRESAGLPAPALPAPARAQDSRPASPLQQLTRTLERFKAGKSRREPAAEQPATATPAPGAPAPGVPEPAVPQAHSPESPDAGTP